MALELAVVALELAGVALELAVVALELAVVVLESAGALALALESAGVFELELVEVETAMVLGLEQVVVVEWDSDGGLL